MPSRYQPGQKIDHYAILSLLSAGTASAVYLALDRNTGQKVVLKFPKDDVIGGKAIFDRYQREAQIGKLLCRPHVVQYLNQDEERQENYLVLEYLQGQMRLTHFDRVPKAEIYSRQIRKGSIKWERSKRSTPKNSKRKQYGWRKR